MNFVLDKENELGLGQSVFEEPRSVKVYLHNDDFTPMDFVIEALSKFFHFDEIKAKIIMNEAHTKGRAVCGSYSKEIAETRIGQAVEYARTHDHPLIWSMEAS